MPIDWINIRERFILHLGWSMPLTTMAFLFLGFLSRRDIGFLERYDSPRSRVLIAALSVFAISALREPYDMWTGQPALKAGFDFLSWALGCGLSTWGLYRAGKDI